MRCLEAYFNLGNTCWEKVVQVVADYPFCNIWLAKTIADENGIDYSIIAKTVTRNMMYLIIIIVFIVLIFCIIMSAYL